MQTNKLISIIIIWVVSLVFLFLFVLPKYDETAGLQESVAAKQTEYANKLAYYAKISEVVSEIKGQKEVLEKMQVALPNAPLFSPLMYFLQKEAGASGLEVQEIRFSKVPINNPEGTLRNISFSMKLSGSYLGIRSFLSALDNSAFLLEVKSIALEAVPVVQNPDAQVNQLPAYNFTLEAAMHSY